MTEFSSRLKGGTLGAAIGDALGVPVEFKSRSYLKEFPVQEMTGYGTHFQPPGTWSDDSSMIFTTMESLCNGYNLSDIAKNFLRWRNECFWTPYGLVFDIGISTNQAILKLKNAKNPEDAGGSDEYSNGNGSLMRILPLAFFFLANNTPNRFDIVKSVSSITHAHIRSVIACYIYTEIIQKLTVFGDKQEAYHLAMEEIKLFFAETGIPQAEIAIFSKVLNGKIMFLEENQISSSGYVIDSLEASLWSFLTTDNFSEAVLKSVNLGGDTDTTGSITGGLAGTFYGYEALPPGWKKKLARIKDIENLCSRFLESLPVVG
jgi:ADP-ribosyl-[dinitrogen reductase] hydrolase